MSQFLLKTRYLILIPILGLAMAAAFFFVFGGIGLIGLLLGLLLSALGLAHEAAEPEQRVIIFEVVEHVHIFLIGTVLYIISGCTLRPENAPDLDLRRHRDWDWCGALSLVRKLGMARLVLFCGDYLDHNWLRGSPSHHTDHEAYHYILRDKRHCLAPYALRRHSCVAGLGIW